MTATTPDVIVYVDDEGHTMSIVTEGAAAANQAPATAVAVVASSASSAAGGYTAPASSAAEATTAAASSAKATKTAASSAASSATAASSAASSTSTGGFSFGYGISYSPYSGTYQDGDVGCKTASDVATEIDALSGYDVVRVYGVDCNQVANVLAAAAPKGMKVMAGVYDITAVESEIQTIVSAVNAQDGGWDNIHTISIGNELVNSGSATAEAVVAAISTARTALSAAGMPDSVYVVTVDTFVAIEENPTLCQNSDYAAANAHAFFDGYVDASAAGTWVVDTMQAVSSACGGKNVVITESGWPTAGSPPSPNNGQSGVDPSTSNQAAAISSIKSSVSSNLVFFTAYNDMWKAPGYLSVEQSWGLVN